jgi:hypothetical protein
VQLCDYRALNKQIKMPEKLKETKKFVCQKTSAPKKKNKKKTKNFEAQRRKKTQSEMIRNFSLPSNENDNCCDDCGQKHKATKRTERNN